jgi:hypothetical protein
MQQIDGFVRYEGVRRGNKKYRGLLSVKGVVDLGRWVEFWLQSAAARVVVVLKASRPAGIHCI